MGEVEKFSDTPFDEDGLQEWVKSFYGAKYKTVGIPGVFGVGTNAFPVPIVSPTPSDRNPAVAFYDWEMATSNDEAVAKYRKQHEVARIVSTILPAFIAAGVAAYWGLPGILMIVVFFATFIVARKLDRAYVERKVKRISGYTDVSGVDEIEPFVIADRSVSTAWSYWNDALTKLHTVDTGGSVYCAMIEEDERMRAALSDFTRKLLTDVEEAQFKSWFFMQSAKAQQLVALEMKRINLAERLSVTGDFSAPSSIDNAARESHEVTESVRKALGN